jgi:anti-sigma factor RsiW
MSVEFNCGSEQAHGALAAYLYGECDAAERALVEAHLAVCAACTSELASLGATRSALASWAPPDAELGFRIVSDRVAEPTATATVLRPARWWQRPLPAWAQAAAAVLIFAAGGLFGMRAGTAASPTAATVVTSVPVDTAGPVDTASASTVSAGDLAALEQRLRGEMNELRTAAPPAPVAMRTTAGDEELIQRVRAILAESERRQEREMSIRLAQVLRDVDMQRRVDLTRIQDTFGQMEGNTGAELLRQREVINLLRQVSFPVQRPQ